MQNIAFYAPSSKFRSLLGNRDNDHVKSLHNSEVLHPHSEFVTKWNNFFLITCLVTLFLDPLYFFIPNICGKKYLCSNTNLLRTVTAFRSITDCFYLTHIILKFRIGYIAHDTRVFGRGELVMDRKAIALRYLRSSFIIDLFAMLPLPQTMIFGVLPSLKNKKTGHSNHTVALIVLIQFIPRLFVMLPLNQRIVNSTGVVAKNAWSGAVYNIVLFILAGHVIGAIWYIWSFQRQSTCWMLECAKEAMCHTAYFYKGSRHTGDRARWYDTTHVYINCDPDNEDHQYEFGMFATAVTQDVTSAGFIQTYFYCLWFGLKALSSYGQGMETSTSSEETLFCSFICVMGLCIFSHLIGQVQNYLQSILVRVEEWRIKRRDTEEWMQHRQLPEELRERIRRFVHYKWLATRGVEEESILQDLPLDIRREIQKHLCLGLVRRVPFFAQMDDQLLDAICERLVSSLTTKDTFIVREGDPVTEMLFIIRGQLESSTTYGGRSGFYNSITLRQGDFCGEELLTWAILPTSTMNLPSSTRTVKALTEVEAFALRADDLKFVATQFKRLQSKKLQHAFRYYSHQWRTWGACFIQAAWRRYKKRKMAEELAQAEDYYYFEDGDGEGVDSDNVPLLSQQEYQEVMQQSDGEASSSNNGQVPLGTTILASKFAANTKRGMHQKAKIVETSRDLKLPKMFKPEDPSFF